MNSTHEYTAEYSKSDRAKCKHCSVFIPKDVFRLAFNAQSLNFDGTEAQWYHSTCFFTRFKGAVTRLEQVGGVDSLRWEHQEQVRRFVDKNSKAGVGGSKKSGKRSLESNAYADFSIEYAKSSRSVCRGCLKFVLKGDVRCSKLVPMANVGNKVPSWHHVRCFVKRGWFPHAMEALPGWEALDPDHQDQVVTLAQQVRDAVASGKREVEQEVENHTKRARTDDVEEELSTDATSMQEETREAIQMQSEALWTVIDGLKKHCSKKQLRELLEANGQEISGLVNEQELANHVADGFLFGALPACPQCHHTALHFANGRYECRGHVSEWSRCAYKTTTVARTSEPYQLTTYASDVLPASCRPTPAASRFERVLPLKTTDSKSTASPDIGSGVFSGVTVMMVGRLEGSKTEWGARIKAAGGIIVQSVDASVDVVVTNPVELQREVESGRLYKARRILVPVVGEAFLQDAFESGTPNIKKHILPGYEPCMGGDEERRSGLGSKRTVGLKGRAEVHPDSGLMGKAEMLKEGDTVYHSTMTLTDVATGHNSFYVLQVLQAIGAQGERGCFLFRAWGRTGEARIGGNKLEPLPKGDAKELFEELFYEKSGNLFSDFVKTKHATKFAGKFYPLEMDYGQNNTDKVAEVEAKLAADTAVAEKEARDMSERTQALLKLLFDMQTYRSAMLELDIDTGLMPLGKLSKRHVDEGFKILMEVSKLLAEPADDEDINTAQQRHALLTDASNRFNHVVPHSRPILIDNHALLKAKTEMVEALRNIEVAAGMLAAGAGPAPSLIATYTKLGCELKPIEDPTKIQVFSEWLQRSHGPTHKSWTLAVEDVFEVDRAGEKTRFEPFKALPNRTLLFHGSRLTNFVGILSQGVRIAPKEAPATGYMFGKGAYFADVPSKSAQYCMATPSNPYGLLLVVDVALGRMHDLTQATYMDQAPRGRHSVRGVGLHAPDPAGDKVDEDGVRLPCGPVIRNEAVGQDTTELQYNEYVVYDASQVRLKYLLKVRFDFTRK